MFTTSATAPGDPAVPSEDWFAVTPTLAVVLDGATVRTDTGCAHGAMWYVQQLGAAIVARATDAESLQDVLADSIRHVASLHMNCDLNHPGTPSAAVGIIQQTGDVLRYLVLGDITLVLDMPLEPHPIVVSDPRVSATALEHRHEADQHPIGSAPKLAALLRMKHAELAARNQRDGYWIAATDPNAAQRAITGGAPTASVRQLAMLSDGAARYVDLFNLSSWDTALRILASNGPQWFIDHLVRRIEDADPLGVRYPRNKRSDDATAVYARLAGAMAADALLDDLEVDVPQEGVNELIKRLSDPTIYGDGNLQRVIAERSVG